MKSNWRAGAAFAYLIAVCGFTRNALAGAMVTITLQPVQPTAFPAVSYPPGTKIVGQEIILGSVPARVWLEIYVSDWAPEVLKTVQATISASDREQDGGGFAGSTAICNGEPANGGNLAPAMQSCTRNVDCRAISGPACSFSEASHCITWDGVNPSYFPAGHFCEPAYQNRCHSQWPIQGLDCTAAIDYGDGPNYRVGFSCDPGEIPIDFHPSYFGTLVLDVPANAKGTYTIDFQENQTFTQNDGPPGFNVIPILSMLPAKISVPCGRCCYELGSANPQCVDHVSANECTAYGEGAVFAANEVCPSDGGTACPACGLDEHCDDGVFCNGVEVCEVNGQCGPGQPPCQVYEECEEATASCAPRIPTVSHWGLVVQILAMLVIAKLRGKPVETG